MGENTKAITSQIALSPENPTMDSGVSIGPAHTAMRWSWKVLASRLRRAELRRHRLHRPFEPAHEVALAQLRHHRGVDDRLRLLLGESRGQARTHLQAEPLVSREHEQHHSIF